MSFSIEGYESFSISYVSRITESTVGRLDALTRIGASITLTYQSIQGR